MAAAPAPSLLSAPRNGLGQIDPRHVQLAVLGSLLVYGMTVLDFGVPLHRPPLVIAAALATQALWTRVFRLPRLEPRSALITSLSLCLLLRTSHEGIALLAAVIAISSKFLVRVRGKHVYNPANVALMALVWGTDQAWVSGGQWGRGALLLGFLVLLGHVVLRRAARTDITWALLASYGGALGARALYLGDPLRIPLHQLFHGGFLLFVFFMISDPKSTPDSRAGRIAFSLLVSALSLWIRFGLYAPHDLLWALFALSPLVPLLDRLLPGPAFRWPGHASPSPSTRSTPCTSPARHDEPSPLPRACPAR